MEITGTVFKIFDPKSGVGAKSGKTWVSQSFLIEIRTGEHGQYSHKVLLSMFGEDLIKKAQLSVGLKVKVVFELEARESSKTPGTWYNDTRVYDVVQMGVPQQPVLNMPQQPQYQPQPQQGYFQPQQAGYQQNTGFYQPQPMQQGFPPQQTQQFPPQQGEALPF